MTARDLEFLSTQHPFDHLSDQEMAEVALAVKTRVLKPGTSILKQGGAISGCLHVVAEGIEQQGMQDSLTDMGCDFGQGYHIARPMPEDALMKWLSESHWVKRIA